MGHSRIRHAHHENDHRIRHHTSGSRTNERQPAHSSGSRYGGYTHGRHSSVPRPSYDPTRVGAHRARIHRDDTSQDHARVNRSSRSRAPTRASTLYPDDSISNANGNRRTHLPYRFEDCHQHGTGGYPPTLPNNSGYGTGSRHDSRGTRRSCTLNSGPAYGYISSSRSQMAPDMASRVSSSTVTHPFAYDAAGVTHTWHP